LLVLIIYYTTRVAVNARYNSGAAVPVENNRKT